MKIYLIPFGGLGNRMRVMNSAAALNKKLRADICLVWLVKPELNIPFTGLFESAGFSSQFVGGLTYTFFLKTFKHIFVVRYERIYRFFANLFFDTVIFDSDVLGMNAERLAGKIALGKKVLIATCYEFYPFGSFDNYVLNKDLQKKVNTLKSHFDDNTVGVHIRRTDHSVVIGESPLEKYFEEMDRMLEVKPATNFFLATDDPEVKSRLAEQYRGKVITQDIPLSRSSGDGMIGAAVDIYCLSETKTIICNLGSSFAKTAALIGKTKEIVEIRS